MYIETCYNFQNKCYITFFGTPRLNGDTLTFYCSQKSFKVTLVICQSFEVELLRTSGLFHKVCLK